MYSKYSTEMEQILDIDTLKIAKEELREDESTRDNALIQMRLWLKQNNKISYSRNGNLQSDKKIGLFNNRGWYIF